MCDWTQSSLIDARRYCQRGQEDDLRDWTADAASSDAGSSMSQHSWFDARVSCSRRKILSSRSCVLPRKLAHLCPASTRCSRRPTGEGGVQPTAYLWLHNRCTYLKLVLESNLLPMHPVIVVMIHVEFSTECLKLLFVSIAEEFRDHSLRDAFKVRLTLSLQFLTCGGTGNALIIRDHRWKLSQTLLSSRFRTRVLAKEWMNE